MNSFRRGACVSALAFWALVSSALSVGAPGDAPGNTISTTAGVDNSTMGIYRALAEVSLDAFSKGDNLNAARVARSIELVWDVSEDELKKKSPALYREIDSAMDSFIKPIMGYKKGVADGKGVESAYQNYLAALKKADQAWD